MTLALDGRSRRRRGWLRLGALVAVVAGLGSGLLLGSRDSLADSSTINFESYVPGTVDGQDGWSSFGAAGHGCAVYDHAIVTNSGAPASFATKSLRISNAVTSGCLSDQTFSKSLVNEAGEAGATNGGYSGGARQTHFEASFDVASTQPTVQPGLMMSVSPDRGDGARMSYLRIEDQPAGFVVYFDDVQGTSNPANFVETSVASGLSRTVPHNLKFSMDFIDGPSNDVVRIYVDGVLVHAGTSWENYFRYDSEASADSHTHTVDSLAFLTRGTAVPANAGKGFLVDNLNLLSSDPPCTTVCYAAPSGSDGNAGTLTLPKKTIQAAINAVNSGGTVNAAAGTYVENVIVNKPVSIVGAGQAATIVEPASSAPNPPSCGGSLCAGASNVFLVQASNVTISNLKVDGDNPLLLTGVSVGGANIDARNGIITDHTIPGLLNNLVVHDVTVKNIFLRGMYASTGGSFDFHNNTVTNVQADPSSIAMFAWGGPGLMSNNTVSSAGDAISANHSKGIQFLNNHVTTSGSGVHTDNAGDGGGVADLIQGNSVASCTTDGYGVWVFVPYIAPTVRNNTVTGCSVGLGAFGGAFLPSPAVSTTFSGNSVNGLHAANSIGVLVQTDTFYWGRTSVQATFDHNTVVNNQTGVKIDEADNPLDTAPDQLPAIATAVFHNNAITGNATVGLTTNTAALVNATCNWWGSATGPGVVGPGSGDTVSSNVTFSPWLLASTLNGGCAGGIEVTSVSASTGDTNITVQVRANSVTNLFGVQAYLTYNSTLLTLTGVTLGGGLLPQSIGVNSSGSGLISFSYSEISPTAPVTGSNVVLATLRFTAVAEGTASISYQSANTTMFSDNLGNAIGPATRTDGTITITTGTPSTLESTVSGTVLLQGRTDHSGATVQIDPTTGPTGTTDSAGLFSIASISVASHMKQATMLGYLKASGGPFVTAAGANDIGTVTLLGGDANGDGVINILDLSLVAGSFGLSHTVNPGDTTTPDINGDTIVNILDLSLTAANYGLGVQGW